MITTRVFVLALFASEYALFTIVIFVFHWLVMFIWILNMKTNFADNKFDEIFFDAIMAAIFIFCFFNLTEGRSRYRYTAFYLLRLVEDLIMLILWCLKSNAIKYCSLNFVFYFAIFVLGLISMVIIY